MGKLFYFFLIFYVTDFILNQSSVKCVLHPSFYMLSFQFRASFLSFFQTVALHIPLEDLILFSRYVYFIIHAFLDLTDIKKLEIKVTRSSFKDLEYVRASDGTSSPQHLIVYVDSRNDRDQLMVRIR